MKTVAINIDIVNKSYSITCRNVDGCSGWYIEGQQLKARKADLRWDGNILFQGNDTDAEAFKATLMLAYRALGYEQVTLISGVYSVNVYAV